MHELDARTLRYLTELDHRDHEAMCALDESGEGVGVAGYVRSAVRPDTAEVAVAVVDGWQGRGLGTLLLEAISARARRASAPSRL
jgi:GNAT superfamily N-acetyltransferase